MCLHAVVRVGWSKDAVVTLLYYLEHNECVLRVLKQLGYVILNRNKVGKLYNR